MEPDLIATNLCKFNTIHVLINSQNPDTYLSLQSLISLIFSNKTELDFILVFIHLNLNIHDLLKMLNQGLLYHVWVVCGEEVGVVRIDMAVVF
jgi:hypothetical protein